MFLVEYISHLTLMALLHAIDHPTYLYHNLLRK